MSCKGTGPQYCTGPKSVPADGTKPNTDKAFTRSDCLAAHRAGNTPMRQLITILATLIPAIAYSGETAETKVDAILKSAWSETNIQSSPICSDEQFLRRISLDLIGRIPTMEERSAFLASPDRSAVIERLLESPEFPKFWGPRNSSVMKTTMRTVIHWLNGCMSSFAPIVRTIRSSKSC